MNVYEKAALVRQGRLRSVQLCEEAVARIQKNDQAGRCLNAVSALAPDWREQAEALDANPHKADTDMPLYGIPVLVKDNIEVKDMCNSAGSYVLRDLIAEEDSPLVQQLRKAGAVILGKCCLSEFAYWMSEDGMPSGYSSMNGQVVHPYNPSFDPSGSSSGSAVACAARYCDITVGTETDGSLMSPAIANAIVSLKPTVGLVSRRGILPLSHVQDTAGPMANNVEDCVALLQAMAFPDPEDPASANAVINDYRSALDTDLSGRRIGVFTVQGESHDAQELALLRQIIERHGGEVYEFEYEKAVVDEFECFLTEFHHDINHYLREKTCRARTLADIIAMNEEDPERCLRYGQTLLQKSNDSDRSLQDISYISMRDAVCQEARQLLNDVMEEQGLSCLVTVASSTITNLAAVSGACSMTLPARPFNEAVYEPLSYYLMAGENQECELIRLAYTLEQERRIVSQPSWLK